MIASVSSWGTLIGGILFGMLADRIVRAKVFTWTLFVVAFSTGAIYFAHKI
ncbi:hypothetical protein [Fructobacillus cardui]|uniref:hypothetical protein n=1 Tax=Fructobacillus cardui TaxID=2893170 RepID=UPI00324298A3